MKPVYDPSSDDFRKRIHRFRHNGNLGKVATAKKFLILYEDSLTDQQKLMLFHIQRDLGNLYELIYQSRKELDGSVATQKHGQRKNKPIRGKYLGDAE